MMTAQELIDDALARLREAVGELDTEIARLDASPANTDAVANLLSELEAIEDVAAGHDDEVFWVAGNILRETLDAVRALIKRPA